MIFLKKIEIKFLINPHFYFIFKNLIKKLTLLVPCYFTVMSCWIARSEKSNFEFFYLKKVQNLKLKSYYLLDMGHLNLK